MKNIFRFLFLIIVGQTGFSQDFDVNQITKKSELNISLESKMRGIEIKNVTYFIEKDLQTLSAYKNGKLKWQTNIILVCGKPSVGKSEIRVLNQKSDKLLVIFGKHSFAEVNVENGKTKFIGSD